MSEFDIYEYSAHLYDMEPWLHEVYSKKDIPFYMEYAKKCRGKILDIGCGTGRVLLPLAKAGYGICGMDLSDQMIDQLKKKILELDENIRTNIRVEIQNMANFDLNELFSMVIIPCRGFAVLTTDDDRRRSLQCIMNHLEPDGIFIVNIFRKPSNLDDSSFYSEKKHWEKFDDSNKINVMKFSKGIDIDKKGRVLYSERVFRLYKQDGTSAEIREPMKLSYYEPEELEGLLRSEGFHVHEAYGDYDRRSIKTGPELIYVCGKRGSLRSRWRRFFTR